MPFPYVHLRIAFVSLWYTMHLLLAAGNKKANISLFFLNNALYYFTSLFMYLQTRTAGASIGPCNHFHHDYDTNLSLGRLLNIWCKDMIGIDYPKSMQIGKDLNVSFGSTCIYNDVIHLTWSIPHAHIHVAFRIKYKSHLQNLVQIVIVVAVRHEHINNRDMYFS